MPLSARKAAGIIRNVLPKRLIERPSKPVFLGSRKELINRRIQIQKWEKTKSNLLKTPEGRKLLAQHFPRSYQKALLAQRSPELVKTARSTHVRVVKELRQPSWAIYRRHLARKSYQRIMKHKTPQLPQLPPFPTGKKKIYLPNVVVTLRRNERLEPYHAVFDVPLNFSKLDLRDYLWHLYRVKTISIRSSILPGVLKRKFKLPDMPRRVGPMRRTRARKKMIVQLAKPFRYPRKLTKGELKKYVLDLQFR